MTKGRTTSWEKAVIALALALVVLCGNILAKGFGEYSSATATKILDNLFVQENSMAYELLADKRIYQNGVLYLKAVAEGLASFSQLKPTKGFFQIMESLPKDADIESFALEDGRINIVCRSSSEKALVEFATALQSKSAFGGVVYYTTASEDGYIGQITCIPASPKQTVGVFSVAG